MTSMTKQSLVRRTLGLGFVAGLGYALWRAIEANRVTPAGEWEAQPFPFPPQPRRHAKVDTPVVDAVDGSCPLSHPVKAKHSGGIFHVPGGSSYDRTRADVCYRDAAAAEAAGLRQAKH
jgi:hypothetical protein